MRNLGFRLLVAGMAALVYLPGPAGRALAQGGDEKLPSGVVSRLKQAGDRLARAEAELGQGNVGGADRTLVQAERYVGEIEKQYAETLDHPDVKAVREGVRALRGRIDAARKAEADADAAEKARAEEEARAAEEARIAGEKAKQAAEEAARAKREEDSAPWVERLGPYVTSGDPRHFLAGAASRPRYEELSKLFEEYRKVPFPAGKSGKLEWIEEEIARELGEWPKCEEERIANLAAEAAVKLSEAEEYWMKWAERWPEEAKKRPAPAMDVDQLRQLETSVSRLAEARSDHPELEALQARLAAIRAENEKRLEANLKSRVMGPDRYKGADAEAIRAFVASVLTARVPGAVPLRVTIQSESFETETVDEWTDNTRSAVRHRVTRFLWAQVAAREGDRAFVHGAYVAQDRQADGSWGRLYGHTTWKNRILEENVAK